MNLNKVFILLSFVTHTLALSSEEIEGKIGNGCRNKISFTHAFFTESGSTCESCKFCVGSALRHLFDPKISSTCVECNAPDDDCKEFKVYTSFENAWKAWFFSVFSSDASTSNDPKRIKIEGSNSFNGNAESSESSWHTLYDSEQADGLKFLDRNAEQFFSFPNDQEYKSYAITFTRMDDAAKLQIGHYAIIQSYTKDCTSLSLEQLTGRKIAAPTETPTVAPTETPTVASTEVINLAMQGTATQSSNYKTFSDAGRAIDGNTDGGFLYNESNTVTHTSDSSPWWKVVLAKKAIIKKIVVWKRTGCCSFYADNLVVHIVNSSSGDVIKRPVSNSESIIKFEFQFDDVIGDTVMVTKVSGTKVIALAEVQVFGYYV